VIGQARITMYYRDDVAGRLLEVADGVSDAHAWQHAG